MDLDIQVSKLKLMKSNYLNQIYRMESDIARNYPSQIAAVKERIAGLKVDLETAKPALADKDNFSMVIGGKTYTDKKEAGTALIAACAGIKAIKVAGVVGEYHGFTMTADFEYLSQSYYLTLKGQTSFKIELGKDAQGNIQRINNVLASIENKLKESEQKLETLQGQLATAKEEVEKPFPQEQELAQKSARLAELNILLDMDKKEPTEAIGMDEEEKTADRPAIRQSFAQKAAAMQEKGSRGSVLGRLKEKQEKLADAMPKETPKKRLAQEL